MQDVDHLPPPQVTSNKSPGQDLHLQAAELQIPTRTASSRGKRVAHATLSTLIMSVADSTHG